MTTKSNDQESMRVAFELARASMADGRGGPFGAVIVRDGQIVGHGANSVVRGCDPTAHAEVVAIRDACRTLGTHELGGATIFTTCEPCPMCLAAIYWARIDRIYFAGDRGDAAAVGFDDAFLYEEMSTPLADRKIPSTQMERDEAAKLFSEWLANPARIHY